LEGKNQRIHPLQADDWLRPLSSLLPGAHRCDGSSTLLEDGIRSLQLLRSCLKPACSEWR
jgi:hypothetical protein